MQRLIAVACIALAIGLPGTVRASGLPLHMLAVRLTDLKPGYRIGEGESCGGYVQKKDVGYKYNLSNEQLTHYGWENGFETCYASKSVLLNNEVQQFYGAKGAAWFGRVMVGTDVCGGCLYRVTWKPHVGQWSVGITGGGFIGLYFRERTYAVELLVSPRSRKPALLALARLVDQRIRQHG